MYNQISGFREADEVQEVSYPVYVFLPSLIHSHSLILLLAKLLFVPSLSDSK